MWNSLSAWREILARVLEGFAVQYDVVPGWLVNPETNRRLKLDMLYPEIGLAIRFQGLQIGGRPRRLSLEEEHQQQQRDQVRTQLCREHGIRLVQIDVLGNEPASVFQELRAALSDITRRIVQSQNARQRKAALIERVSEARSRLEEISRRVRRPQDLRVYADLWHDRQFIAGTVASETQPADNIEYTYTTGMAVRHADFGDGYVVSVREDATGRLVTVMFEDGVQRTFAVHLVGKKMAPRL
ncbi:MAG: hypothetical protein NZ765_01765 [Anaerolineae bacterium]|nr:hypothetical protein [Anaerolineae bacterium]MDW8070293.1 hypothetical protein [Anaerolineae bacterium]